MQGIIYNTALTVKKKRCRDGNKVPFSQLHRFRKP